MFARKLATSLTVILLLVLILAFVPFSKASAAGTITVNVNDPACVGSAGQPNPYAVVYCSIKNAITDAVNDDTLLVKAGTYLEENILINKPLSLKGDGKTTTIIDTSGTSVSGNVLTINLPSGSLLIDGFTIRNGDELNGIFHTSASPASIITISNNKIVGKGTGGVSFDKDFGILGGYGSVGKVIITQNEFIGNYNNMILFEAHLGESLVSSNTFTATAAGDGRDIILYRTYDGNHVNTLQKVTNNTINLGSGAVSCSALAFNSASHIYDSTYPDRIGKFTNIEISGNTITNVHAARQGISLSNDNAVNGVDGEIASPVITNNTITGVGDTTNSRGIQLLGLVTNASITNNSITAVQDGIRLWDGPYAPGFFPQGTIINKNYFANNTVNAVNWMGSDPLDATCNWWSAISGPTAANNPGGLGQAATPNLVIAPWLVYGSDASPSLPGFQLPTLINVSVGADTSLADNDYRRLANAIACVQTGQTVNINGTFDLRRTFASQSYPLGADGAAGDPLTDYAHTVDNYRILAPTHVNTVSITATSLGSGAIQGPSDLGNVDQESFLTFWDWNTSGFGNQGWTISNLNILDFDQGIQFKSTLADQFHGTTVTNNRIRVAVDLNGTAYPNDPSANNGIRLGAGKNQTVSYNTIEFYGTGTSDPSASPSVPAKYAWSNGVLLEGGGGDAFDGLWIINNQVKVLNAQDASNPAMIIGVWDNSYTNTSNITVTGNQFTNQSTSNDPEKNRQSAFRLTSHSGASTNVSYINNSVQGANIGFEWLDIAAGSQPLQFTSNTVTNTYTGALVRKNCNVTFTTIQFSGAGATKGAGIKVDGGGTTAQITVTRSTIRSANIGIHLLNGGRMLSATENFIIENTTGIQLDATAVVAGTVTNNDLSSLSKGINNLSATLLNASVNWWGTNIPNDVYAKVNGNVDFTPWLHSSTDTQTGTPGFQGGVTTVWVSSTSQQSGPTGVIQEGINLIPIDGTVNVAAGTYPESFNLTKSMSLKGPNTNVCASDPTNLQNPNPARLAEATITSAGTALTINTNIDNVSIDGLAFSGLMDYAIYAWNAGDGFFEGITIKNNLFTNLGRSGFLYSGSAISSGGAVRNNWAITCNRINEWQGTDTGAIWVGSQSNNNGQINNNFIRGKTGVNGSSGITISGANSTSVSSNVITNLNLHAIQLSGSANVANLNNNTISAVQTGLELLTSSAGSLKKVTADSNTISNVTRHAILVGRVTSAPNEYGILEDMLITNNTISQDVSKLPENVALIDLRLEQNAGIQGSLTVDANTITLNGSFGRSPATVYGVRLRGKAGTVNLTRNTLNGGSVGGSATPVTSGIYLQANDADYGVLSASAVISITNNYIRNFNNGITVYNPVGLIYGSLPGNITLPIHQNSFSTNSGFGLRSGPGAILDATLNWWNTPTGPTHTSNPGGVGDTVSDSLSFSPWLCNGEDTQPATPGFQPDVSNHCAIAVRLVFSTQPGSVVVNQLFNPQPIVRAEDMDGNLGYNFNANVSLAIASNPGGGSLHGSTISAAVNGVAPFSGLYIDKVGEGYTLSASSTGITTATSSLFNIYHPDPVLTTLSPNSAIEGDSNLLMGVTGSNFFPDSVVYWNGSPRTTLPHTSTTELFAVIMASDLANAGTAQVTVYTPFSAYGFSNALFFEIKQAHAVEITPAADTRWGSRANQVTYTLTVKNTGYKSDTFMLTQSGNQWQAILSENYITLAAGAFRDITVTVTISPSAASGSVDALTITAWLQQDPDIFAESVLTTHSNFYTALPLTYNNFIP